MTSNWEAVRGDRTLVYVYITLHIGERFGAVNLLSVVSFVSSSLCLHVLICNGIDSESSVGLIVARRDVPTLRTVTDQAAQSASQTIILQVTAA